MIENKLSATGSVFAWKEMEGLGLLLVMIGIAVGNLPAVMHQWRTDRAGFNKTIGLAGAYILYVALGVAGMLLLIRGQEGQGEPERAALLLTGAIAAARGLSSSTTLCAASAIWRGPELDLARLDLGEIEHLVDERQERLG